MNTPRPGIPEQIAYIGTLLLERFGHCLSPSFPIGEKHPSTWSARVFSSRQQTLLLTLGQSMVRFSPKAKDLFHLMFLQQFTVLSAHLADLTDHILDLHRIPPLRSTPTRPRELLACGTLCTRYLSETLDALLTGPSDQHKTIRTRMIQDHEAWNIRVQSEAFFSRNQAPEIGEHLTWGRLLGLWEQVLVVILQMNTRVGGDREEILNREPGTLIPPAPEG